MKRLLVSIFLFGTTTHAGSSLNSFLTSKHFSKIVAGLKKCGEQKAGVYLPIELRRIDLVDEKKLLKILQDYSKIVNQNLPLDTQIANSCHANEALDFFMRQENRLQRSLLGSFLDGLKVIPESLRWGLSPVDSMFLRTTELGKKITSDLAKKPEYILTAVSIERDSRRLVFEGLQNTTTASLKTPQPYYEVLVSSQTGSKLKLRTQFIGDKAPASPDIIVSEEYFGGYFLNTKTPAKLPFGPFPAASSKWVDESGLSHFSGDGHQH